MYNDQFLNTLGADWDLGDLLMMQMRYSQYEHDVQSNMGADIAVQQVHRTLNSSSNDPNGWSEVRNVSSLLPGQAVAAQSTGYINAQENPSSSPESFGNTEDLLSLFSDIPMAFRCVASNSFVMGRR